MSRPILYDYWQSSASYRVRIALNLKRIDYDIVQVDLMRKKNRESDHLDRNPQGLVPTLAIDGHVFSQSMAILQYLDMTVPENPLFPDETVAKIKALAMCYAIAMETHPVANPKVARHVSELANTGEEGIADWARHYIRYGLTGFEGLLANWLKEKPKLEYVPHCAGCCLVPQYINAVRWDMEIEDLPLCRELFDLLSEHPAYSAAHPEKIVRST